MMSDLSTAPSAGVPVQIVIPVNEVAVFPVYSHVPVPPTTVNFPVAPKLFVDATLSVPPARFWPAPLTVVASVPANAFRSMLFAVIEIGAIVPFSSSSTPMSIAPPTPSNVDVIPTRLVPLPFAVALNAMFPVPTLIVTPSLILIVSALTVRFEFGTR